MTFEGLHNALFSQLGNAVTVDIREVEDAPGFLRITTIFRDLSVNIEYERATQYVVSDIEGAELKYQGSYPSLEEAVVDLEELLGKPISQWRDYGHERYEPATIEQPNWMTNQRYFEELVRTRSMRLPVRGNFRLIGSVYYVHIDLWGEFRPDRLGEEMEIIWRHSGIHVDDEDEGTCESC